MHLCCKGGRGGAATPLFEVRTKQGERKRAGRGTGSRRLPVRGGGQVEGQATMHNASCQVDSSDRKTQPSSGPRCPAEARAGHAVVGRLYSDSPAAAQRQPLTGTPAGGRGQRRSGRRARQSGFAGLLAPAGPAPPAQEERKGRRQGASGARSIPCVRVQQADAQRQPRAKPPRR
jgi:hypothetical protein